jgi:hypothetical protein
LRTASISKLVENRFWVGTILTAEWWSNPAFHFGMIIEDWTYEIIVDFRLENNFGLQNARSALQNAKIGVVVVCANGV